MKITLGNAAKIKWDKLCHELAWCSAPQHTWTVTSRSIQWCQTPAQGGESGFRRKEITWEEMRIETNREIAREGEGSVMNRRKRPKSWMREENAGAWEGGGVESGVTYEDALQDFLWKRSRDHCKRMDLDCAQETLCLHNHVTCIRPSSIFSGSPRLHRWQWQSKGMRSNIFQVKRRCMPQALGQMKLCPSPCGCMFSFQHHYTLFGTATLQIVEYTMHLNIQACISRKVNRFPTPLTHEY